VECQWSKRKGPIEGLKHQRVSWAGSAALRQPVDHCCGWRVDDCSEREIVEHPVCGSRMWRESTIGWVGLLCEMGETVVDLGILEGGFRFRWITVIECIVTSCQPNMRVYYQSYLVYFSFELAKKVVMGRADNFLLLLM